MKKFEPLKTGDYILISLAIERVIFNLVNVWLVQLNN